jgi:hypothetical protein
MRRSTQTLLAAAAAILLSAPAFAACAEPAQAPVIPDGVTATMAQMTEAHAAVQSYVNVLQSYQDCLEAQIKMAPKGTKAEVLQKMRDEGNAAIDEAKALGARYKAELTAFKARPAK